MTARDDAAYWQYHAVIKDVITEQLLSELQALLLLPEGLRTAAILARIDQLEKDS